MSSAVRHHTSSSIDYVQLAIECEDIPEQPRYIIVAFQTDKDRNQEANPSIFDHCDLTNMYIMLNQERYPAVDHNLSFPNQQFSRAYYDASKFSEKFYGMNDLITQSNITPVDFKDFIH